MTSRATQPWILGLTGGIGSGKSAAARCFVDLGVHLVDADDAARWVVEPGRPALARIAEHFGDGVLQADGALDRTALRELIFKDPQQRVWLEGLLHPLIRDEIRQYLSRSESQYSILVSPLLLETTQHQMVQRVLVIDVPEAVQIERTLLRDKTNEAQVRAILNAQASREVRLSRADDVIVNDRDPAWLKSEVERLHHFYLTLNGGH